MYKMKMKVTQELKNLTKQIEVKNKTACREGMIEQKDSEYKFNCWLRDENINIWLGTFDSSLVIFNLPSSSKEQLINLKERPFDSNS